MRCSLIGLVHFVSPLRTAPQGGLNFDANYTNPKFLRPATPCLLRCILIGCLGVGCLLYPTQAMVVGSPLGCSPTIVVVGYLPQCIDPCVDALGLGLGSLPIAPIGAVSYHLIIPDPSALTCQDFKERKPDVLI